MERVVAAPRFALVDEEESRIVESFTTWLWLITLLIPVKWCLT
jgi:hypothetical protein